MKRYILAAIMTICLPLVIVAEQGCDMPSTPQLVTNFSSPIEVWGNDYEACMYKEWDLVLPNGINAIEINYIVDLNPISFIDALYIYGEDDNHVQREYLHYAYQPISGRIQVYSSSGTIRVVLLSLDGNYNNLYRGFKLFYGYVPNNQIIYSNVGLSIQPQEKLHVNGFIRGTGGHGALRVRTECGVTAIGCDSWAYSHFDTDRPRFFFYKPIMIRGEVSSAHGYDLKLQTYDYSAGNPSTRMTILRTNGNVGIGTETPQHKLEVNGDAQFYSITSETGDIENLQASELTCDTVTAKKLIVEATGADYVFDNSYQLRSLNELEHFINTNGHLPEIQSAEEMQKNGVDVSSFQIQLLQKIEELTLYILQQEKTIKELKNKINK